MQTKTKTFTKKKKNPDASSHLLTPTRFGFQDAGGGGYKPVLWVDHPLGPGL